MIVLDTHVLIWLAAVPDRLSSTARTAIAEDPDRAISAASAQEIAYLVTRGRVELDRPTGRWVRDALDAHEVRPLPVDLSIALQAGSLDVAGFHGDPIDRVIYATAVAHDAALVSADERMRAVDPERLVW
jgi:PIN domain nuclease of toxin-antitoxin system